MSLTREQVLHIARLARVGMTEQDVEKFAAQLSEILDYFQRLAAVPTDDVPPTAHTLDLHNVFREDETEACLPPGEVLANAPLREEGYFRVKAILEE